MAARNLDPITRCIVGATSTSCMVSPLDLDTHSTHHAGYYFIVCRLLQPLISPTAPYNPLQPLYHATYHFIVCAALPRNPPPPASCACCAPQDPLRFLQYYAPSL